MKHHLSIVAKLLSKSLGTSYTVLIGRKTYLMNILILYMFDDTICVYLTYNSSIKPNTVCNIMQNILQFHIPPTSFGQAWLSSGKVHTMQT